MRIFEQLGYTGYTFVIAYKQATVSDPVAEDLKDTLRYSFYFGTSVEFSSKQELEFCFENVIKQALKNREEFAIRLADYFRLNEKCELFAEDEIIDVCRSGVQEAGKKCLCTGVDYSRTVNERFRYSFAADDVSTVAEAIYLLENNCTFLDQDNPEYDEAYGSFCGEPSFNLRDLSKAIGSVEFTDNTCALTLNKFTLARRKVGYNVYQYTASTLANEVDNSRDAQKVIVSNFTAIQFADNKAPISGNNSLLKLVFLLFSYCSSNTYTFGCTCGSILWAFYF